MYCLSKFCCVCLDKNINLININKLDDDNIPIINKLIFIVFGHERLDTEIVKLICDGCLQELKTAYKFKTKCLISNELALGYNSQLKFFTGSVSNPSNLNVALSENDSLIITEYLQKIKKKKYKPKPLSKQKGYVKKEIKPEPKKRFKCNYCCLIYFSDVARLMHYNKVHKKHLNYVCSMCNSKFINEPFLKRHMRKVHFDESKNLCRHCKINFSGRKPFLLHMKTKHNYSNFTCEICSSKFLKEANYKTHLKRHTLNKANKTNKVPAGKKSKKRNARKQNKTINKSLKMITRYLVCKTCDGIFINSAQLEEHAKTHEKTSYVVENGLNVAPSLSPGTSVLNPLASILEPKIEIKEEEEVEEIQPVESNNFSFTIASVVSMENSETSNNKEENTEKNLQNSILSNLLSTDKNYRHIYCNICFKNFKYEFSLKQHLLRFHNQ